VGDFADVIGVEDDAGVWEIALEAADLDVAFFTDDDGEVAFVDELGEFAMGDFDKGAGGIGDAVAGVLPAFAVFISGAVSGDDDVWSGGGAAGEFSRFGALR